MNRVIILILFFLLATELYSQKDDVAQGVFDSISVSYVDSVTNPKEDKLRELTFIGDDPYFSKPTILNIQVKLHDVKLNGRIQIQIEEFFKPDSGYLNNCIGCNGYINTPYWTLHEVIGSYYFKDETKRVININNVDYKTVYFRTSYLIPKFGFRFVAIYYPSNRQPIEVVSKQILFEGD